ncbi:hypothetical protein ACWD4G_05365 [Streptomyces sp. NPDC002643]
MSSDEPVALLGSDTAVSIGPSVRPGLRQVRVRPRIDAPDTPASSWRNSSPS